jgi:lipoprotein-releasing system permease protein
MSLPFFIARRYLFAKKSHNVINIVSLISVVGIGVGAMALIIVLSVFNGFEKLILSMFDAFNPDLEITISEGKTFRIDEIPIEEISKIPGVLYIGEVVEESAMITYRNRQHLVRMRGVSDSYFDITGIDTMIVEGELILEEKDRDYLLLGQGVAYMLNSSIHDIRNFHNIYVPKRGRQAVMHPSQAFNASSNFVSGIFGMQSEFDMEHILVPIRLARSLLEYEDEVTSLFISIDKSHKHSRVQKSISNLLGDNFVVKNRLQQQEFLYKIMQSEKWAIYLILTFILIIAAFNVIGSLTMLVIEKRKDIKTLWFIGADKNLLRRIFLIEGIMISIGGAFTGLLLGALVCWVQMEFGIISLSSDGSFIIDAYPVAMNFFDFVLVAITVIVIGFFSSILPVRNINSLISQTS